MSEFNGESNEPNPSLPRLPNVELLPEIDEGYLPKNVSVHFHLTAHGSKEHLEGIRQLYPTSDIFIPENGGHNAKQLRDYNAISKGERKTYESYRDNMRTDGRAFSAGLLEIIYGTYKPIDFIDIDDTIPVAKTQLNVSNVWSKQQAIDRIVGAHIAIVEFDSKREATMVRKLGPVVTSRVVNHPKLVDKDVNVLVFVGNIHQPVYEYLAQNPDLGDRISGSCLTGTGKIGSDLEIDRSIRAGDMPPEDTLLRYFVQLSLTQLKLPDIREGTIWNEADSVRVYPDTESEAAQALVDSLVRDANDPVIEEALVKLFSAQASTKHKDLIASYARAAFS